MNIKRIYKRAMAEFLLENGCTLIERVKDVINDTRYNWLFLDDQHLKETMKKFPRKEG